MNIATETASASASGIYWLPVIFITGILLAVIWIYVYTTFMLNKKKRK